MNYVREVGKLEQKFVKQNYESSLKSLRSYTKKSLKKDRLLYFMEAGIVLHTSGDYAKSLIAFKDAEALADSIMKKVGKGVGAFLLNDTVQNFVGENFERVQIKFYIALNHMMLGDFENAKRALRRMDYELRDMKYGDAAWKQNLAGRYLNAIVSEHLKEYNDARVQYNNLIGLAAGVHFEADKKVLGVKEGEALEFSGKGILAFNRQMEKIPFRKGLAELVLIHQAGMAPIKMSRGKLAADAVFKTFLEGSIRYAVNAKKVSISVPMVLGVVGAADNPIPVYKRRDRLSALPALLALNGRPLGPMPILDNFETTAILNYNEQYEQIAARNIAALSAKIITAMISSSVGAQALNKGVDGDEGSRAAFEFLFSLAGAGIIAAVTRPDLRSWHLISANVQIVRLFLEPGKYKLDIQFGDRNAFSNLKETEFDLKEGELKVSVFRSHGRDLTPVDEPIRTLDQSRLNAVMGIR